MDSPTVSATDYSIFSDVEAILSPHLEDENIFGLTLAVDKVKARMKRHLEQHPADKGIHEELSMLANDLDDILTRSDENRATALYEILQFICNRTQLVA